MASLPFACLALALAACAGAGSLYTPLDGSTSRIDAGVMPSEDAGAGVIDGARPLAPDGSPLGAQPEGQDGALTASDITGTALDSCYDGLDNNHDGLVDCQDDGCAPLASCCAADGAGCCDPPIATTLPPFASCTGSLVTCMLPGVSLFGSGAPYADSGDLFPGGDHLHEGGAIVAATLDRTRTTLVSGTVALPTAAQCGTGCVDAVGLGLITETTLGATSSVRPVIALVASASLQQVMLVSGVVVLASTPVTAVGGASFPVTLTLTAAGVVTATVGGASLAANVATPGADLHLVIYGHNENTAGIPSSRVRDLALEQAVCDTPGVWGQRSAVTIGGGASTAPAVVDGPSVGYSTTDAHLAFATDAGIFVAHRVVDATDNPSSFALQAGYGTPDIAGGTFADPDIHFLPATGTWRIYLANTSTGGIEMAEAPDASSLVFGARTVVLLPSALPTTTITALDGPSVAPSGTHGRTDFVMTARARYADGHTAVVLLTSPDGVSTFSWLHDTEASSTVPVPTGLEDIAHDEVSGPSLVYRDGAWELYYAGRTLGRWSIGLMLSDDLLHWRAAPSPAVLVPTGVPTDLDAFSVRDPGVALVDGNESRVELFYAGTDGASTRIGRVERTATISRGTHP